MELLNVDINDLRTSIKFSKIIILGKWNSLFIVLGLDDILCNIFPFWVTGDNGDGSIVVESVLNRKVVFGEVVEAGIKEIVTNLSDN